MSSTTDTRKLFVNLAVQNIDRSRKFFAGLGFEFNPKFSDENALCMIVSEHAFFMLLQENYFKTFTKRNVCDSATHTGGLYALSCSDRESVDNLVKKAVESGGQKAMEPVDHGFMYNASFYDPDGHHFEVFWMSPEGIPQS